MNKDMVKEREEFELIMEIVKRADEMNLMAFDRLSLSMDLETAHKEFNLRLDELLKADRYNFAHDIVGIQNNINRLERKMEGFFLPRFATQ